MDIITFKASDYEKREIRQTLLSWQIKLEVEIRVYVVEAESDKYEPIMDDEEFIQLAEESGRVYTLDGFQEAFNYGDINSDIDIVRFITVSLY